MGISYAGVSLPVLTPEAYKAIESRIPLKDMCPWPQMPAVDGRGGFGQAARKFMERTPQVGHLTWPTGASRWATGFFLATDAHLKSIRDNIGETYAPADLVMGDGSNTITASMYMLPARPLLGSVPGSELWLLVLVDQRYFWWSTSTDPEVKLQYYAQGTTNPYADLMALLPGTPDIDCDTIDGWLDVPPPLLLVPGEAVPPILDWYALCFGQHIVCDLDGTIHARSVSVAQTVTVNNLKSANPLVAGGELALDPTTSNDLASLLPEAVRVDFIPANYGPPRSGGTDSYIITLASLNIGYGFATNGSTVSFTMPNWNPQGGPLAAISEQWATDYYAWLTASADYVFAGIAKWQPSGLETWIDWQYNQSQPAGVSTRVHRYVYESSNTLPATPRASVHVTNSTPQTITLPGGYTMQGHSGSVVIYDITVSGAFWFVGSSSAWLINLNNETPTTLSEVYDCQLLASDQNNVTIWGAQRVGIQLNNYSSTVVDGSCATLTGDVDNVITFVGGSGSDQIVVATASPTQYGVVTTIGQTFGGNKTFNGSVICSGGLEVLDASSTKAVWSSTAHDVTETFYNSSGSPVGTFVINDSNQCIIGFASVSVSKDFIQGQAVNPTISNSGFLYISTCPGTPTGTPTVTGYAAIIYDDLADRLWVYSPSASAWKIH